MQHSPNKWTVSDYISIGLKGMLLRTLGGIDVTYRCNLSCRHCYFTKQGYQSEWSTEQWLDRFEEVKKGGFPFMICGCILPFYSMILSRRRLLFPEFAEGLLKKCLTGLTNKAHLVSP